MRLHSSLIHEPRFKGLKEPEELGKRGQRGPGPLGEREAPGAPPAGSQCCGGAAAQAHPQGLCQLQTGVLPRPCPSCGPRRSCPSFTWAPVFASGVPAGHGPRASTPVPLGLSGALTPSSSPALVGWGWAGPQP